MCRFRRSFRIRGNWFQFKGTGIISSVFLLTIQCLSSTQFRQDLLMWFLSVRSRRYTVNNLHLTAIGFAHVEFQWKCENTKRFHLRVWVLYRWFLVINCFMSERIWSSRKTHRTGSRIKSRASRDAKGAGEAEVACKAQRLKRAATGAAIMFINWLRGKFDDSGCAVLW